MTRAVVPPMALVNAACVITTIGVALPPPVVPPLVDAHPMSGLAGGGVMHDVAPPLPPVPLPPVPLPPVPLPPVPLPPVPLPPAPGASGRVSTPASTRAPPAPPVPLPPIPLPPVALP